MAIVVDPVHFFMELPIDDKQRFKYVRFVFPVMEFNEKTTYGELAELEFIDQDGNKSRGTVIHSSGLDETDCLKVFDNQSYTSMPGASVEIRESNKIEWLGLDFEKSTELRSVRIMPRNDDIYLFWGANYELSYWHDYKWMSLETKKVEAPFLTFDNVPKDALLLLRGLDLPLKERPFTYENEQQR